MQFAHFGKSGRKEEAFALSASSSSQEWTIGSKNDFLLFCLYIYINKIKIKQAALSWLKLPVRFPARNDSNGRGLSICLQCGLFAYLIQKALLNYSSTASVSSTTECRSPRNPFFFKSSLFSSSPFFHSSFSSTCHCLEICLAPFFDYWRINSLPLLSLLLEVQSFKWNPKNGK